jgi:phosphatidylserine/phosphatidylglycerophosphate/cardiolipin synthase-like enzyme
MPGQARAIANNDLVYLWWTYPEAIADCLGFSVRRLQEGREPVPLPASVGFPGAGGKYSPPVDQSTTDVWPIQAYQWKDLWVPEEEDVEYEIVPMTGVPGQVLEPIPGQTLRTPVTKATDRFPAGSRRTHRVVFNRGIISTQPLAAALPHGPSGTPSKDALHDHIELPGDAIRERLAGEAIKALTSLLHRARRTGGRCFCALYELADKELIDTLVASAGHVELVLANADGSEVVKKPDGTTVTKKVVDQTNRDARVALHTALGASMHDRILPRSSAIGHNKFVVYVDPHGTPKTVLTGSTNWTSTGLCSQSNNVLILDDDAVAARYLDYWNQIKADGVAQGPALRTADAKTPPDLSLGTAKRQGSVRVWFSPNTEKPTKSKTVPPPDMDELFTAISNAKSGVLFLLFSAGSPSIMDQVEKVAHERAARDEPFFVQGAVSDARTMKQFRTRVYKDTALQRPRTLITGIGGIPDQYFHWEKELAQLGFAVIHDKIVVIDPFDPEGCLVATGSHNLGWKASSANDENLCLIRGNPAIAETFAAHVLDIVNHYNWRYKLTQDAAARRAATRGAGTPKPGGFHELASDAAWQAKYFRQDFMAQRDRFFFPG